MIWKNPDARERQPLNSRRNFKASFSVVRLKIFLKKFLENHPQKDDVLGRNCSLDAD
jgi:hypothetical protein